MGGLVEIRNELRQKNLHDTEEPPLEKRRDPGERRSGDARGAHGRRHQQRPAVPEDGRGRLPVRAQRAARARLPRYRQPARPQPARRQPRADDARRVQAGDHPQPAGGGVDSVHGPRLVRAQALEDRRRSTSRRRPATTGARRSIRVPRVGARAGARRLDAPARLRQPQQPLVGRVADLRLRSRHGAEAAHATSAASCASSRPGCCRSIRRPACTSAASPTTGGSAWRCSTRSSRWSTTTSAICWRTSIRDWTDEQLYRKAKLINSALMAKIHTVEWTPAIVPHPIIKTGDERRTGRAWPARICRTSLTFLDDKELLGGIVGSHGRPSHRAVLADRGVRRRLPHAPADARRLRVPLGRRPARLLETRQLAEIAGRRTPGDRRAR